MRKQLTLQLNVAVHETDAVHPPNGRTELAKDAPSERFLNSSVPIGEEVEEFTTGSIVEDENGIDGSGEGC